MRYKYNQDSLIILTLVLSFIFIINIFSANAAIIASVIDANAIGAGEAGSCIEINLGKATYFPRETVQIEIDADIIKDILSSDLFLFRKDRRIPINFFISKITKNKFFIWFDLPSSDISGYVLKVRGVCKDGLHVESRNIIVEKTIASSYKTFETEIKDKWLYLSLENHILSAGALAHTELASEALNAFTERDDSCINKECSTEFNAFTMISFKDSLIRQKMQKNLEASQNIIDKGEWKLKITSQEAQKCNVTLYNQNLNLSEKISLNLIQGINEHVLHLSRFSEAQAETINILLECEKDIDAKIIFIEGEINREFSMIEQNFKFSFSIYNNGCWGDNLKTSCDARASAFSLLALAKTNKFDLNNPTHSKALAWLKENSRSVEEKAVVYYLTGNKEEFEWLLNMQSAEGWWPLSYEKYQPDIKSSCLALFALKNIKAENISAEEIEKKRLLINKAQPWFKQQFNKMNTNEKAFTLLFAFSSKEIEPVLAIWPGVIKTKSSGRFNLILQNKGTVNISLDARLLNTTIRIKLPTEARKNIEFNIPLITTTDGRTISEDLILDYNSVLDNKKYTYNIPTLIFTQKSEKEYLEQPTISEEELNLTEQQKIINETQSEWETKTTELNESLIQRNFKFIEHRIMKNISKGESASETVKLANLFNKDIEDITITYSSTLIGLIERIEPSYIDKIESKEKKDIVITILAISIPRLYEGNIIATAEYNGREISASIPVLVDVAPAPAIEKNCSEIGGAVCKEDEECEGDLTTAADTFSCCIGECKKKEAKGKTIGLIIIIVIVIALLVILAFLRKKPKKEMKEFLKEATQQYEKRFQRPPSIRR